MCEIKKGDVMTKLKKEIYVFVVVIIFVTIANMVQCYNDTKTYTVSYPKTIQEMQKSIDEDITEINDKAITKGSVILLVTKNNENLYLYHLKRGFFTLKYKIEFYDTMIEKGWTYHIKDCFEKFDCYVSEKNQIEINPASFASNLNWNNFIIKWLAPVIAISAFIIVHFVRKKE